MLNSYDLVSYQWYHLLTIDINLKEAAMYYMLAIVLSILFLMAAIMVLREFPIRFNCSTFRPCGRWQPKAAQGPSFPYPLISLLHS